MDPPPDARGHGLDLGPHLAEPPGDHRPPVAEKRHLSLLRPRRPGGSTATACSPIWRRRKAGDLILLHACCHNPTGRRPACRGLARDRRICAPGRARSPSSTWPISASPKASRPMPRARVTWPRPCPRRSSPQAVPRISASTGNGRASCCRHRRGQSRRRRRRDAGRVQPAELHLSARSRRAGGRDDPVRSGPATDEWRDELRAMRRTMLGNRAALAEALAGRDRVGPVRVLAGHRGMFSLCGATPSRWPCCARPTASTWWATGG
jgi:hypothetical protein